MNLLLLLSALLSALTGVGASARVPEPARAVAAISTVRSNVAFAAARVATRPANGLATLAAVAAGGIVAPPAIVRAPALWADRRRE